MVLLLAAAAISGSPAEAAPPPLGAQVQAQATVRIVSGMRVRLDGNATAGAPKPRETQLESRDGSRVPAKLIEFE